MLLYVRMLFSMIVSLYTSRVVLQVLGVEDFGVYGVVGGIVSLFTFINGSMAGCTSRFLTFELGRGDWQKLHDTFSTALIVHVCIAMLILIVSEPVGIWFLENKLQVPEDRLTAAPVVVQLSVVSMMVGVTQVPYNASIMSHERMDVYAYIEIANVVLRLLIVYLLQLGNFDKLILYAALVLAVSVLVAASYRLFCVRHFAECHFKFVWRKDILKQMMTFSGWDLYGNMSVTARTQGVNMLLNMFFGPVMNAAASIAAQVQGAVLAFVTNITTAVRPQIIKRYAAQEFESMVSLIRNSVKLNYLVLMLLSVPLITELHFVLQLWLGQVPDSTVTFCVYTLLFNVYSNLSLLLVTGIHATGKIFRPSIINGTLYLLVIPLSYISFKFEGEAYIPYLFNVLAVVVGMLSNAYTLRLYVPAFPLRKFVMTDLLPCTLLMLTAFVLTLFVSSLLHEGWVRLLAVCAVSSAYISLVGWVAILPKSLRLQIVIAFKRKTAKIWKKKP